MGPLLDCALRLGPVEMNRYPDPCPGAWRVCSFKKPRKSTWTCAQQSCAGGALSTDGVGFSCTKWASDHRVRGGVDRVINQHEKELVLHGVLPCRRQHFLDVRHDCGPHRHFFPNVLPNLLLLLPFDCGFQITGTIMHPGAPERGVCSNAVLSR